MLYMQHIYIVFNIILTFLYSENYSDIELFKG